MLCSKCQQPSEGLTDSGLCPDCHLESEDRREEVIALARDQHQMEGSVEIGDNAQLSEGNGNGCFVQTWVWVGFEGTRFDKEKEEDEARNQNTQPA